jgi:excisionase family DNA binding protein
MDELQPRSEILKEAWERARGDKTDEPAMLSVVEAHKRLGVSKTTLYDLMNAGELGFVKIKRRRLIPVRILAEFIRNMEEKARASLRK